MRASKAIAIDPEVHKIINDKSRELGKSVNAIMRELLNLPPKYFSPGRPPKIKDETEESSKQK